MLTWILQERNSGFRPARVRPSREPDQASMPLRILQSPCQLQSAGRKRYLGQQFWPKFNHPGLVVASGSDLVNLSRTYHFFPIHHRYDLPLMKIRPRETAALV